MNIFSVKYQKNVVTSSEDTLNNNDAQTMQTSKCLTLVWKRDFTGGNTYTHTHAQNLELVQIKICKF